MVIKLKSRKSLNTRVNELFINNELAAESHTQFPPINFKISDAHCKLFLEHQLSELFIEDMISIKNFAERVNWWPYITDIEILRSEQKCYIQFFFSIGISQVTDWKKLWSYSEYIKEYKQTHQADIIANQTSPNCIERMLLLDDSNLELKVLFNIKDITQTVDAIITCCSDILRQVHQQNERLLTAKLHPNSVITYFDFPEEVEVACKQYLLYFVDFLRDLGIKANAEFKNELGNTLFAVTPSNPEDAFDKIHTALNTYLSLPSIQFDNLLPYNSDIELQQLNMQLNHYKNQVSIAMAKEQALVAMLQAKDSDVQARDITLRAKDATIEAQSTTITSQKLTLDFYNYVFDGIIDPNPTSKEIIVLPREDKEKKLPPPIVELEKVKMGVFSINLPEIIRRLKERLNSNKG